jgi:hypothetical protein
LPLVPREEECGFGLLLNARGFELGYVEAAAGALGALFGDEPIDEEQQDRSYNGRDEAGCFTIVIPAQGSAEKACDEGSDNADEDGDDNAARVFARHDEFSDGPDDEADD